MAFREQTCPPNRGIPEWAKCPVTSPQSPQSDASLGGREYRVGTVRGVILIHMETREQEKRRLLPTTELFIHETPIFPGTLAVVFFSDGVPSDTDPGMDFVLQEVLRGELSG